MPSLVSHFYFFLFPVPRLPSPCVHPRHILALRHRSLFLAAPPSYTPLPPPPQPLFCFSSPNLFGTLFFSLNCFQLFPCQTLPLLSSLPSPSFEQNWKISNIFHNCQCPISSFSPPALNQIMRGFIFDGNFSKPGLARHQIKWKFVISFKYAQAFRICQRIQWGQNMNK